MIVIAYAIVFFFWTTGEGGSVRKEFKKIGFESDIEGADSWECEEETALGTE